MEPENSDIVTIAIIFLLALFELILRFTILGLIIFILYKTAMWLCN